MAERGALEARREPGGILQADDTGVLREDSGVSISALRRPSPRRRRHASTNTCQEPDDETLRAKVHRAFEEPSSSKTAYALSFFGIGAILASSATLMVETLPAMRRHDELWYGLELGFTVWFSVEYVARFWAAPQRWLWFKSWLNIADLVAVLPFYIDLLLSSQIIPVDLRILRLLRVIRVFRVFKMQRFVAAIAVVYQVLRASAEVLLLGGFMLIINIVVFSTGVFFAEQGISYFNSTDNRYWREIPHEEPQVSPFQSALHAFWWSMVTIATVGYGDDYPVSALGKTFASVCMVQGLLILSLPTSIIASNFLRMYKLRQKYGSEWTKYIDVNEKQVNPPPDFRSVEDLERASLVLHMINDLEARGELLPPYTTWARKVIRDRDMLRSVLTIYDAAMLAPESDRHSRFGRHISEVIEEYAWATQRHASVHRTQRSGCRSPIVSEAPRSLHCTKPQSTHSHSSEPSSGSGKQKTAGSDFDNHTCSQLTTGTSPQGSSWGSRKRPPFRTSAGV